MGAYAESTLPQLDRKFPHAAVATPDPCVLAPTLAESTRIQGPLLELAPVDDCGTPNENTAVRVLGASGGLCPKVGRTVTKPNNL